MYAGELSVQPIQLQQKDTQAEVRGFVWSQIFSNFVDTVTGNNKK